jgi:putative ABC transport system permease protein
MSAFYRDLEARVARRPGVQSVAAVNQVPLNGALASTDYKVQGRAPAREDQLPTAQYRMVTPAFFRTLGIPLLAGRAFDDRDRAGAPRVAVVSRALARRSFPDRDPVGQVLLVADTPDGFRAMEIVGVAGDVKHQGLETEAEAHLYVPYHQTHPALLVWLAANQFLAVRAAGSPLALAEAVRADLAAVDANVAAADPRLSGSYVEAASGARRFSLVLVGLFAAAGLLLAGIGIFGVVSYSVAQRTRETGVRLALGATAADILALVVGQSLGRAALGIAAGLLAALPTGLALRSQLYGVAATDPVTYGAVVLVLLAVALLACAHPAWRAARSSPLEALRQD